MNNQMTKRTITNLVLFKPAPEEASLVWWDAGEITEPNFYKGEAALAGELSEPITAGVVIQWPPKGEGGEFEGRWQWLLA